MDARRPFAPGDRVRVAGTWQDLIVQEVDPARGARRYHVVGDPTVYRFNPDDTRVQRRARPERAYDAWHTADELEHR
jgi:hypothetical protein